MQLDEFSYEMKDKMKRINIDITNKQVEKFFSYMNLLIEWNKKINLTTIIEPKEIIIQHFVDCGTILKYLKDGENVIDIGTGAGFPGIPVKILNENLNVAKRGGGVAKGAKDLYEKETKKSAISKSNSLNYRYLDEVKEQKQIEGKKS